IDEPILDVASVQARGALGIADLPVALVDAHNLVAVDHAVEQSFRALAAGDELGVPAAEPRVLLVWRDGVAVYHRRVDDLEISALALAAGGVPFGVLCESLAETVGVEHAPRLAAELLGRWLTDRLLVASGM